MKTYVTISDFNGIINSMTGEEIKEKYGRLIVISEKEYKEEKSREKNKKR